MRILWLSNNDMPAVARHVGADTITSPPWQASLIELLASSPELELSVGCMSSFGFTPFRERGVLYFSLNGGRARTPAARVANRWREKLLPPFPLAVVEKAIRDFGPDVIHVQGTEHILGQVASITDVPVVVSLQGILACVYRMDRRGVDLHLLRSTSPSLLIRGGGMWPQRLEIRLALPREQRILRLVRHFIGRTQFDANVMRALNPSASYYHCDETLRPAFYGEPWTLNGSIDGRVYTTTGDYARKDVRTLLEALAVLRDTSSAHLSLRIAGDFGGHEGLRAVQRVIQKLRLQPMVRLLDVLDEVQIADELRTARVFAYPSHADNSPNSLAEALLVGTPSVASSAGGIPSLARDERHALLVQDGDPYALAGALRRMLEDSELSQRLSSASRALAQKRHDPSSILGRQLAIYRQVAASTTPPRT